MKPTTYSLDLAKRVFQVHSVDMGTGEITREALSHSHTPSQVGCGQVTVGVIPLTG